MRKITLIIPTFNEEHNIEAAIESVDFADEVMIVDSYSTDKTVELAKKYTNFIIQRDYEYSASQKNWAIPQATHEWIFLLDADERVTPELNSEILSLLKNPSFSDYSGYWIRRINDFMGTHPRYGGWNDKVIRLFRKSTCQYQDKRVHAEIISKGKIGFLKAKLYHDTYISFDHYLAKLNRYAWWQAKDLNEETGKITFYHFFIKPSWRFFKHYIIQGGFRDGLVGFVISYLYGYSVFTRYVKIWLMRRGLK
jgi:glycosyltransferase involved in cell wall biosynthesis